MKIYIAHSKEMDYVNKLYNPLRKDSFFQNYELILPHENDVNSSNDREFYKNIDIFIADVSESAIELGIELGWVYDDKKTIYCIYEEGKKISNSVKTLANKFFKYKSVEDIVEIVKTIVINETNRKD